MRLYINVDHIATVRQARGTDEPDPVRAAVLAELGGADGITVHLREDRRHIQDRDVELLLATARTPVNLEFAVTEEMLDLATSWLPYQATLVPEKRQEITTEGGLEVSNRSAVRLEAALSRLEAAGVRTSLFIDPDVETVRRCADLPATAVEFHTGEYSNAQDADERRRQVERLRAATGLARELGLAVHAGHGLTYENVAPVAAIEGCEELNIGHSVVSRAVLVGLERAVREMKGIMRRARGA
ncbi:MAG: pyridoxine 5'-phosphate synthase [marine benthic group bacterium]|jgi:pyridoxine 5-phosphate synthase|nr:pyridoxine 5'-phosphate synthase [Candidatus Benthicola marisminoris]